jgi:Glycosyltransferase like family 2
VLRNERNVGQVPSLNRGLREARGDYVARLDADDVSRPRRLERQVAVLEAEPSVGLVGAWLDLVDERGRPIAAMRARLDDRARFLYETLLMNVLIAHPAAAYRREPVLALGGYDESTGPAEDKDLWRKLALAGWDARIVPEPLVVYRVHDAQLSKTQAAYQREIDAASQERFLAALLPGADVRPVRLLLADDAAFWGAGRPTKETLATLEHVLAALRERVELPDADAVRLERLVAGRVAAVARRRPWSRGARVLAAWSWPRLSDEQRPRAAARHAFAFALAPPARATARTGRAVSRLAERTAPLRAIRDVARRSRLARRLYAKLVVGG